MNFIASPGLSRRAPRGFTLVEVVVSLAVLSLILLATVSALRTFANTQVSLGRMIDRVDEVRTVSSFLRDMLEGAVTGENQGGGLTLGGGSSALAYFEGDEKSLEWKAPALFGEVYGGVMLMRLIKEESELKLYWQEPPVDRVRVSWDNKDSRVLLTDVGEFVVEYKPEYDSQWQRGEWEAQGAPALVRLSIKASGRHWPDLILRVQR